MVARDLLDTLRQHNCQVRVEGGRLLVRGAKNLPPALRKSIANHRRALIRLLEPKGEPAEKAGERRYGTGRTDVPRCHGCGAEVLHWYITECFHCRIGKSTKTGGVSNGDGS